METVKAKTSLALATVATAGALAVATPAGAKGLESPYEPLAAGEGGVVLVEKERVRLEKEFVPLLEANGKGKYLEYYSQIPTNAKERIARAYSILKEKGIPERKTAAAVATAIESEFGVRNAKIIVREWNEKKQRANVETYTMAPGIKLIAKFAPEILNVYDIAELEEIDRMQKITIEAVIAQNRQEIAQNRQEIAQNRQEIAQNRQEIAQNRQEIAQTEQRIAKLDEAISRLEKLLQKY